jgi:hypothetical protein
MAARGKIPTSAQNKYTKKKVFVNAKFISPAVWCWADYLYL